MSSTLRTETLHLADAAAPPTAGPLPILHGTGVRVEAPEADPAMAARIAYGRPATLLPYTGQGRYDRVRGPRGLPAVVLENEELTAVFLPGLGGRLWSLRHRPTGRELLHRNPVFQPANLALRGAWFAGGVEWNLGATGHHPLTCEPLHAARTHRADGTPVLRMYEFERMRRLVLQLDAWLPAGSPLLHVQVTVHNPGPDEVPVYWWSNAAVPEQPGGRVLAPAEAAYHLDHGARLRRVPFPGEGGVDPGRAGELPVAADHFFELPDSVDRPWIAALGPDGSGLVQLSTARLRGRKLFQWGSGSGGRRWQEWLSGPGARYLEVQAGLAPTQLEHLPLPGRTAWSWTEGYGLLAADPATVHGDWAGAVRAVGARVAELTLDTADAPTGAPVEVVQRGSGWGGLEQLAGGLPAVPGLPFPAPGEAQRPWRHLVESGTLPVCDPPAAPVLGEHWRQRLSGAEDWHALLQLGLLELAAGRPAAARAAWRRSLATTRTPWALRHLGELARLSGKPGEAAELLAEAHELLPGLAELTVETLGALLEAGRAAQALALADGLAPEQRGLGRVRLLAARAALAAGEPDRARRLLAEGIEPADLREGEDSLDALWFGVHEAELAGGGTVTDQVRAEARERFPLPHRYDFRMHG
ncbi:DUF5107 domain-containing protein [Kitasatospora sp. NPDC049258]|uniref:DUF5107 domain-containing protein n=1 Tax=Kitasatospora sp. NPDC049258 TaxID=3155394 RepID=UPI00344962CE